MPWFVSLLLLVADWPMFGRDPQHTNATVVECASLPTLVWTFRASGRLWRYQRRMSVWSSSPVAARLGDRMRIFVGSYDHNLYCLEAETGRERWRFTTGGAINAAPAVYWAQGKPYVVAASTDRLIYGLEAETGRPIWSYQVYPWTFTVFDAIAASPLVLDDNGQPQIVVAVWYSDRKPLRNIQQGEVLCLEGLTGTPVWRKAISSSALSSPAYAVIHGVPSLFVAGADGNLSCLDPVDGQIRWVFSSAIPITSSPLVTQVGERPVVIVGTQFGLLLGLDAERGGELWKYKTGMQISSTGAVTTLAGTPVLFVPSYDRFLYSIDLTNGTLRWRFETKQHIASSPVVVRVEDRACLLVTSMDNHVYLVDAETGQQRWSHRLGKRPWFYEARGETLWPSPIAIAHGHTPLLIVPWYDGVVYAFSNQ